MNKKFTKRYKQLIEDIKHIRKKEMIVEFIDGLGNLKPNIIYNNGRDKLYIYGKVWYYDSPMAEDKKDIRFIIGRMVDGESKEVLQERTLNKFFDKYVSQWLELTNEQIELLDFKDKNKIGHKMNSLYIIINPSDKLPYIGMTKDMTLRKYQHIQNGKIKKKSKMVELYKHEDRIKIKMLEQLLIHYHINNISNSSTVINDRKFEIYKKENKTLFPRLVRETNELINN